MKAIQSLMTTLAVCFMCIAGSLCCHAVEAYPYWVDFRQPDGTLVKIRMRGNEFAKWAETQDGHTLLYDSKGFLVYADKDKNGDLVPTDIRALDWERLHKPVPERVRTLAKGLMFSEKQFLTLDKLRKARAKTMAASSPKTPIVGTRRILMILVEYQDVKFKHTKHDFDLLMNQINYTENGNHGNVKDFYLENSFGKLTIETEVAGIYTLPRERAYYGANNSSSNDANPQQMITDAVNLADADVDFSRYDNDGDGVVDGIHVIFAGPGEEAGGGKDCIWSHASSISTTKDNTKIRHYSCSPEIRGAGGNSMTFIGVICHEIGHVLGCMDFYDTNYSYGGQYQGTGKWDLMGSGNWNAGGSSPAHFNPYVKIYDYGWADAIDGNAAKSVTLKAKSDQGFVRIDTKNKGEYFLLEYRSQTGFDAAIPGHGLMVYHAYNDLSSASGNTINAYHQQQFYPVCANANTALPNSDPASYGTANSESAPFPGTLRKTELTDFTTPSMMSWNNVATGCPLTEIKEDVNGESVSFDIDGGANGGAYNFRVTDSNLNSISLAWDMLKKEDVLLACSESADMGEPDRSSLMAGETLDGGGKVLYVGKASSFKHDGLEAGVTMYYKLFTRKPDGTWTAGRTTFGRTEVDVIRRFPYVEDFETGLLDNSWKQEHLFGNNDWKVDYLGNTGKYKLQYILNDEYRQTTRLVSPVIDFTGKKNAILSFSCINNLQPLRVLYRTTPTGEWKELLKIASDYNFDIVLNTSSYRIEDQEKKYYCQLPDLTATYQVAFVADYVNGSNVVSSVEQASLDDISIKTDYDAVAVTNPCSVVGNDFVETAAIVYAGNAVIAEYGVEWSTNQKSWTAQKAAYGDNVRMEGLPKGSLVYYRSYAKTDNGKKFTGDVLTVSTMSFTNGKGTEESPYVIGNSSDWKSFLQFIENGNECRGLHFMLSSPIDYTFSFGQLKGIFNGILDGNGQTVNVKEGKRFLAMFFMLGQEGKVHNLNVNLTRPQISGTWNAGICSINYGEIANCNINCKELDLTKDRRFGGVCSNNYGAIVNCHSTVSLPPENTNEGSVNFGGICMSNLGLVSGCSFDGNIQCNNSSKVGGIAAINTKGEKNQRLASGIIADCVNRGKLEVVMIDDMGTPRYNSVGGISGSNYGLIDRCANLGELTNYTSCVEGWPCCMGGITGSNSYGTIQNSYNKGKLTAPVPFDEQQVGGIAGSDDRGSIVNCVDMYPFSLDGAQPDDINGIVGWSRQTGISNCFYTGSVADKYATKCDADTIARLADILNAGQAVKVWNGDNGLRLERELTGINLAIGCVTDFTSDHIAFKATASGEALRECGAEWRKYGDTKWNDTACTTANGIMDVTLDRLEPATCYEVRIYATANDGTTHYSDVERVATMFATYGNADDPHMINDYNNLLAFNEMIVHGEQFALNTVRLTSDIDLRGNKGVLWTPMQNKYNSSSTFRGEFDGNGRIIRNMKIRTAKHIAGFFGSSNGYIHDLQIWDADIESYSIPAKEKPIGGTGGIVGCNSWRNPYEYAIERCGFKGRVRGNGNVGGIAGDISDKTRDCYAIADLECADEGRFSVSGIANNTDASHCYSVVEFGNTRNTYPISQHGVEECYYSAAKSYYTFYGTRLDKSDMQTGTFLEKLTPGIWTRADYLNDGLPVLAGLAHSRVTTVGAEHDGNADIVLQGLYTVGTDKDYHKRGFQWYSLSDGGMALKEETTADGGFAYSATIPNRNVTAEGIVFRSFAEQDGDSLLGEWKMFVPTIRLPRLEITSVTSRDGEDNETELGLYIDCGTCEMEQCSLYYREKGSDSQPLAIETDSQTSSLTIRGLVPEQEYEAWLRMTSTDGREFESQHVEFSTKGMTGINATLTDGRNADIHSTDGILLRHNADADALKRLPKGIYIVGGKTVVKK